MIHFCSIFLYKGFDGSDIISLVILAVLICISAFASGSETALFSLSPGDIRTVKNRGNKSDEAILKLLSTEDYTLATILILNNLVNIIIVILSNGLPRSIITSPYGTQVVPHTSCATCLNIFSVRSIMP